MSVKILSLDAKSYIENRIGELRHIIEVHQNSRVKTWRGLFLANLHDEIAKKLRENSNLFQLANDEGTVFGGSKDALNAMFKKEIRGTIVLCRNAFFEVQGLYSEDEAIMAVQDKIKRDRAEIEYLKLRDAPGNRPGYERIRIPEKVRNEVWRRDQGKCLQCGSVRNLEFDHLIPLSKGGSNTVRNLQLLCENCNRRKSDAIG